MNIKIFTDGGARGNPGPAAAAFSVESDGSELFYDNKYLDKTTNNVAEYEALLMAHKWISENNFDLNKIDIFMDSELIVKQMKGLYKVKNDNLKKLFEEVVNIKKQIGLKINYTHIPREKNIRADFLVNKKLDEVLHKK